MGEPRFERLAEHRQALGQLHAVEAELHLVMVAADVDLSIRVLRHAGCLQQRGVQRRVVALRQGLNGAAAEVVAGGAQVRLQLASRLIQPAADHVKVRQADVVPGAEPDHGGGGARRWLVRGDGVRGADRHDAAEDHGTAKFHGHHPDRWRSTGMALCYIIRFYAMLCCQHSPISFAHLPA